MSKECPQYDRFTRMCVCAYIYYLVRTDVVLYMGEDLLAKLGHFAGPKKTRVVSG